MQSEQIALCPKCGAAGVSEDHLFVGCADIDCTVPEMMMQDWNRLSRAAALLRAGEGLEQWLLQSSMRSLLVRKVRTGAVKGTIGEAGQGSVSDDSGDLVNVLIALWEARDETK